MTDQENKDLEELHKEINKLMVSAFSGMRHSDRMNQEELKNSGYKTTNDTVVGMYKYYQKQIDDLTKAHIKKYPD